jgi:DNA-binding CsgD family transcriptional regulator
MHVPQLTRHLSENDLVFVISIMNRLLQCAEEEEFHALLLDFGGFLHFEFVLYGYTQTDYDRKINTHIVNLSNPSKWHEEYSKNDYLSIDPVRIEFERRLASSNSKIDEFILWDVYDRELSPGEIQVIEKRRRFGLVYGCSVFNNSVSKDSGFLLSLSDRRTIVDRRHEAFCRLIVSHMNICRKRLNLLSAIHTLSKREKAAADLLILGKTNGEISQIMGISERTVKYHIANIFQKLGVCNRQNALSILLAAQYLS